MAPAIRVMGLSKRYRIGSSSGSSYRTLRESIVGAARVVGGRLTRPPDDRPGGDEFWALRDVSFDVAAGQVLGIIGRNGAGKSTLLKILSRVTKPTGGRALVRGRLGSLLEVGTGFHPELTGRENIYLSGNILGMSRREIDRKFDEIVAFAEIDSFLDTPVKRYSNGMYMRLGFAVAAHLETEVLIVDEVLAVGDIGFQQKCLGKMRDVGQAGRTVLFVSHNLSTIASLCHLAITLEAGRQTGYGPANEEVARYLSMLKLSSATSLAERSDRSGSGAARIVGIDFLNEQGVPVDQILSGEHVVVRLAYRAADDLMNPVINMAIYNDLGAPITFLSNAYSGEMFGRLGAAGELRCDIPALPLAPGDYRLNVCLQVDGHDADHIFGAAQLRVNPGPFFASGKTPPASCGYFLCQHRWQAATISDMTSGG